MTSAVLLLQIILLIQLDLMTVPPFALYLIDISFSSTVLQTAIVLMTIEQLPAVSLLCSYVCGFRIER